MGKRASPKLVVKKETLRKLGEQQLGQVVGGAKPPTQTLSCARE